MFMKNSYPNRPKLELAKMCNKASKEGTGDLCISLWSKNNSSAHNHQITKESFLDFVAIHYGKELKIPKEEIRKRLVMRKL